MMTLKEFKEFITEPKAAPMPSQLQEYADALLRTRTQVATTERKVETREQSFPSAPEPSSVMVAPVNIDRDVLAQHVALASKLGVHSNAEQELAVAAFEAFLQECGLRVYNEAQVAAYLTSKYGVEKKQQGQTIPTWGWRPAREKDRQQIPQGDSQSQQWQWQWAMMQSLGAADAGPNGQVHRRAVTYRKPIPIPVLLTIERVVEKFPGVGLYVSDEFNPREFVKDPFLMVVHHNKRYIIERWDEPNYRER